MRMGYVQFALRIPCDLNNPHMVERARESLLDDLNNPEAMLNIIETLPERVTEIEDPNLTPDRIPQWLAEDAAEADDDESEEDLAGERYIADFDPQAWINDHAVSVDPKGDREWDCTKELRRLAEAGHVSLAAIDEAIENGVAWLDSNDVLKHDPAAPAWVRDWDGPFSIHVKKREALVKCQKCEAWINVAFAQDSPAAHADASGDVDDPRSPGDHADNVCDQCTWGGP